MLECALDPWPEAMVKIDEKAKQQAEVVGVDIPVVAVFKTFSMDGIQPNIEVPRSTELLLTPEEFDLPAVNNYNLDNGTTFFRERIHDILREVKVMVHIKRMHLTVVRNMSITGEIVKFGVPKASPLPLPVYKFAKALENKANECLQEIPLEEPDNKSKVGEEDTGMEEEKDAEKDRKEKPEKESQGQSKNMN